MLLNQVDDSLQDQILPRHRKPDCKCLCNEAPNIAVNRISAPGSRMPINDLQHVLWRHVTGGHPKYAVHDHCQIYDVAHHTTDILWAIRQKSQIQIMEKGPQGTCLPAFKRVVDPIRVIASS